MTRQGKSTRQILYLIPLLLLAFALRVHGLEHHNIWGDEAFSIALSKQPISQIISGDSETNPPLYHVLLHYWISVSGESIFSVRYLSVIPGILLVPILQIIARHLFGHPGAALAAVVATLSSFAIYYSQETRMYAWAATLSSLSVYASLRLCQPAAKSNRWRVAFLASTLAAVFTHYYSFLVLAAQNVFMIKGEIRQLRSLRPWLILQVVIGLSFLPWILTHTAFIGSKANTRIDAWGLSGMNQVWASTLWAFGIGTTVSPREQWLGACLLIVVAMGLRSVWRSPGKQPFVIAYLLVPFVGAWIIGPLMPFFYQRYLITAFPAYVLLLVAGLLASARPLLIGGLSLALVANGVSLYNYYTNTNYAKGGYGDLMAYLHNHTQPKDGLLLQNGAQSSLLEYYGPPNIQYYNLPPWDDPERAATLDAITATHPRLWLLMYGDPVEYDPTHEVKRWISNHAFRVYHGGYVDGSLDLYVQGKTLSTIPFEAHFANLIALRGYGLNDNVMVAGNILQLALYWEALGEIPRDYTIFVHLIDSNEQPWAMADSQPLGGSHPTSKWAAGETVVERIAVQLDPDTPPGDYHIQLGWYDLASMERLPAKGNDNRVLVDRVLIGPIHVKQE